MIAKTTTPAPAPAELIERLNAVDHYSVEDCFLLSPLFSHAAAQIQRDQETIKALVEAIKFAKAANESLVGCEKDLGEQLSDGYEIGRIVESRHTPLFRIRVGHIRKLAAALRLAGEK